MKNINTKAKLASYFQSGDVPTEAQFGELIDAALDLSGNGAGLTELNANNISAGTLDNTRLPTEISGKTFSGNGAGLTELNANNISAGVLNNGRLATEISGKTFSGNGAGLTDLNADNISAGTLDNTRLPTEIRGKTFSGSGAGLSDLDADNISAGTLDNSRLATEISGKTFSGNGANLTDLNADNISSGIVPTNNLPEASTINLGIMRFANEQELEDGNDNVAITSRVLKEQVGELKLYSESQVPEILNASETVSGIIQLATQDEAEEGTSETTAISPSVLKNALDQKFIFIKDTGQDPNTLTINEGQIVALYTDLNGN